MLRNKSLKEIGNAIGVSFQQMQKYERGINRLSSCYLYEIAEILEIPINDFFPDSKYRISNEPINFGSNNLSELELNNLIKYFSKIKSKEVRKKMVDLAKTLA